MKKKTELQREEEIGPLPSLCILWLSSSVSSSFFSGRGRRLWAYILSGRQVKGWQGIEF